MTQRAAPGGPRRRGAGWWLMALASALGVVVLCALGVWQVQRLHWKTDLIARVEARLAAPPAPAPGPGDWLGLTAKDDEYRRVAVTGRYDFAAEELAQAVTAQGPGFWVMTPLETSQGWAVWINRGFVPMDRREVPDRARPDGTVEVTGLLRMTQPGGAFLRKNDPQAGRWYSRDVAALSAQHGIAQAAPYFIDAEAGEVAGALPVGGLTVVSFRNTHLSYALTWFAMATGLAAASVFALRRDGRDEP